MKLKAEACAQGECTEMRGIYSQVQCLFILGLSLKQYSLWLVARLIEGGVIISLLGTRTSLKLINIVSLLRVFITVTCN
jgi:hypothetical protein